MKKTMFLLVLLGVGALIFLSVNFAKQDSKEKVLKDVTMTIKENTLSPRGATIIITDTNKKEKHIYSEYYRIERQDNGNWVSVDTKTEADFSTLGIEKDNDNKIELDIDWEWLYGSLPKGNYRLAKKAEVYKNNKNKGERFVYVEFRVA